MKIEHHLITCPSVVQVVLHGEPIPLEVYKAVSFFPLHFCKFQGKKLVVEDEEYPQVGIPLKITVYSFYRGHFLRYFWFMSNGLSGMVLSRYPASIKSVIYLLILS